MNVPMRWATIPLLALAIAGCGTASHPARHTAPHTAAPVAVAVPTPPSCLSQMITWRDGGGLTQIEAVATDLSNAQAAAAAQDLGALQGAATTLGADAQTALGNLPPSCVPGMAADYATSMRDCIAAAASANQGTVAGLDTGAVQIQAAGAGLRRATRDFNRWQKNGS